MYKDRPEMRISTTSGVPGAYFRDGKGAISPSSPLSTDSRHLISPLSLFSRISSSDSSSTGCSPLVADVTSDFGDLVMTENDKIIMLMGQTGSGKSTFINCAFGSEVAQVTHAVTSCTQDIHLFQCPHPEYPNQKVFLVDTPGFDSTTTKSPKRILRKVSDWLIATYRQDVKLTGILLLQDITQARMTGLYRASLKAFSELCGPDFLSNVVVVSTGWEGMDNTQIGNKHEHNLQNMLGVGGIRFSSFPERTRDAAWGVIDLLQGPGKVLQIQVEVVDQHRRLTDTSAFQSLRKAWNRWKDITY